ncbi:MAG: potassium transporter TrkG [Leptolyngbyaceae cyanobacterium bins.59]|nr:potassium transporter TrkG [Leptolyngbyaceae cyanobacterium bins.59]
MTVSRTICLGFLAVILLGTSLLFMPFSIAQGPWFTWDHFLVALFISTSAVCVTGHIVVDIGTYFSPLGQGIIAALVQIGGLGYMTATTFLLLLVGRRFALRDKIALQQALDRTGLQGMAQVIQSIVATTILFEVTGVFLLTIAFSQKHGLERGLQLALFHSVSAWNNAGFSLFPDNLMSYHGSWLVNLVITGLIIMGGIGYDVIFEGFLWLRDFFTGRALKWTFSLNFKVAVSTTLVLLITGTIAILVTEFYNPNTLGPMSWNDKILAAWFQAVTPRTAGFNTINYGEMTTTALFITIVLMFIGGSPGGTAGGIKTTTLRILTSITQAILQGKEEVLLYERTVPLSLILKATGVAVGSLAAVMAVTILMTISDPEVAFIRILFEVMSAFGTVGLSTGITAALSDVSKLLLIAMMYIGRVGILLLMSAILGDPKPTSVHYPEENLLVG